MKQRFCAVFMSCLLMVIGPSSTAVRSESHHIRPASSPEAEILVRVRGVGVCTGSPISGTNYVVTAAHCVLDPKTGVIGSRYDLRVERDSVRYDIVEILVDTTPRTGVDPSNDAAVLVMETAIPGPGISLPTATPSFTSAALLGFQSLDADGSLLRGENYDDHRTPKGASGITYVASAPAACTVAATQIESREGYDWIPCGMVPGASGGPFVVKSASGYEIIGVVSTVSYHLTHNGITPVAKVIELIENQDDYRRDLPLPEYNATTTSRS